MKFATIASMCLAVTAAPRFADGGGFDELMALVEQLHEEATALSTKYGGMDAEITSLIDQISRCEGGGGGGSDTSTTSDGTEEGESQTFGDDGDDGSSSSGGGGQPEETSSSGGGGEGYPSSTPAPSVAQPLSDDPQDTTADETSGSGTNSPSGSGSDVPNNGGGGGGGGGGGDFKFSVGQSWNYNLATPVNLDVNVDVFFIDMDADGAVEALHAKQKGVVCYISIGTVEDWRDDAGLIPAEAIGGGVDGWAGEKWLDVNNMQVREVMTERVKAAASLGCDGIEPDNMMVYSEPGTGVKVSEAEQIEYNTWFAELVHSHGMGVGLKNAVELLPALVDYFDFALNEECWQWKECEAYESTFLAQGKPVFNVEYNLGKSICDKSNAMGLDTIVKDYDLGPDLCSCVDPSRDVGCNQRL